MEVRLTEAQRLMILYAMAESSRLHPELDGQLAEAADALNGRKRYENLKWKVKLPARLPRTTTPEDIEQIGESLLAARKSFAEHFGHEEERKIDQPLERLTE